MFIYLHLRIGNHRWFIATSVVRPRMRKIIPTAGFACIPATVIYCWCKYHRDSITTGVAGGAGIWIHGFNHKGQRIHKEYEFIHQCAGYYYQKSCTSWRWFTPLFAGFQPSFSWGFRNHPHVLFLVVAMMCYSETAGSKDPQGIVETNITTTCWWMCGVWSLLWRVPKFKRWKPTCQLVVHCLIIGCPFYHILTFYSILSTS